jgi:4-hydroxy 2-oxovalerate aldolase
MKCLKLMDVTLRESIYVPEAKLTEDHAEQLVHDLSSCDIDYIEIGYIQAGSNNYSPSFCPIEYIKRLSNSIVHGSKSKLVMMMHIHQFQPKLLRSMVHENVDMVRLCIPLHEIKNALQLIPIMKKEGIKVSANLIRASNASAEEILQFALRVKEANADMLYLADSNGALFPWQIEELYTMLARNVNIHLGLHAHDNLNLASANALAAIYAGASMIDCSLFGVGKGLSNLCLESFVGVLCRSGLYKGINIEKLVASSKNAYANFIHRLVKDIYFFREQSILVGYKNIDLDKLERLEDMAHKAKVDIIDLLLDLE